MRLLTSLYGICDLLACVHAGAQLTSWIGQVSWIWGCSFFNLVLLVMPLKTERVPLPIVVDVDIVAF